MAELALFGGTPVIAEPLSPFRSIGQAEKLAVAEVMESGSLSAFYGSPGDEYFGGERVRAFEHAWCEMCGVNHALSINSATSGLIAAMGAIGVGPGDEVIVPATTMSATVMAPLFYGAIPVFADIEDRWFCIDPESVRRNISDKTRAILAVDLFGHPAELAALRQIADAAGIYLVEDAAQAPLAFEGEARVGTVGDIGVYSLNYHKHIHTGEGGMCVTNDDRLARRLALIRNHGENAALWAGETDLTNMIGGNLRMTETAAAVGLAQIARIDELVGRAEKVGAFLTAGIAGLGGIVPPEVRDGCRHDYYCWTARCVERDLGVSRDVFCRALAAEGVPLNAGYVEPLYLLPTFQERRAWGHDGFPFTLSNRNYPKGLCPVAERLYEKEIFFIEPCAWTFDDTVLEGIVEAFLKIHAARHVLREWAED